MAFPAPADTYPTKDQAASNYTAPGTATRTTCRTGASWSSVAATPACLTRGRLVSLSTGTRLGRRLSSRDTIIGTTRRALRRAGVTLRPRLVHADGTTVRFDDGSSQDVSSVVWATGFRPDHSWLRIPTVLDNGRIIHRRGVTDVPGLYFLGLAWQHTRGSALLGFVKDDAAYLADRIATRHVLIG